MKLFGKKKAENIEATETTESYTPGKKKKGYVKFIST